MRTDQTFTTGSEELVLAVSLELAAAKWKVALHDGRREKPAVHTVAQPQAAARLQAVLDLIEAHREKWSLPAGVRIVVSYEAGQDAFWICRALQARRHRVLRRRSGEHSGRTPQAAREDRPARCHQAGDQPARVAARRARPHARGARAVAAGRGVAPADARSRATAEGSAAASRPDAQAAGHARLLG